MVSYVTDSTNTTRILNGIPSLDSAADWALENVVRVNQLSIAGDVPKNVDLRTDAEWWNISNQKSTGSCVGWAVADSALRWHFVKKGLIKPDESLSVRQVWMAAKETDNIVPGRYTIEKPTTFIEGAGTKLKTALEHVSSYGIVKEQDLPFMGPFFPKDVDDFYALADKLRIKTYKNIVQSISDIKTWLYTQGPVIVGLRTDNSFKQASRDKHTLMNFNGGSAKEGLHVATLVGYDDTDDKRIFILRNSWGEDWGDKGYVYLGYDYALTAIQEACGIIMP